MTIWIKGAPTLPGYYWIATEIEPTKFRIRMAEFTILSPSGRLFYSAKDSTWEDKRTMSSIQYHIPVIRPEPPE